MKNRILMVVSAVLAAGCGGGKVGQPWDENRDGLIAACEGLDRYSCSATPGCHEEPLACIALCVDDGKGGCGSPCADTFRCVPDRCEDLDAASCSADPRCILESTPVCEIACLGTDCPPCAQPRDSCRTRPPSDDCSARPFETCSVDSRCEVREVVVCEGHGGGGTTRPGDQSIAPGCGGGCTATLQCAPRIVESDCATRDVDSCENDGSCRLIAYACPAICQDDGNGGCKPCALPPIACVPADDGPTPR